MTDLRLVWVFEGNTWHLKLPIGKAVFTLAHLYEAWGVWEVITLDGYYPEIQGFNHQGTQASCLVWLRALLKAHDLPALPPLPRSQPL